jgi:hypothetical protein
MERRWGGGAVGQVGVVAQPTLCRSGVEWGTGVGARQGVKCQFFCRSIRSMEDNLTFVGSPTSRQKITYLRWV